MNNVEKKYDRSSKVYDLIEYLPERFLFSRWRKKMLGKLKGDILEIGVGTGKNLPYYRKEAKVTGIDISEGMLKRAERLIKIRKIKNAKVMKMDAEKLRFKKNTFDYVVCTFVLCSVPDPIRTLYEMKRVLKVRGKILMLEHMLSSNKIIALLEHIHNPLSRSLLGINVNRDTMKNIKLAELEIIEKKDLALRDIFKKIVASKKNKALKKKKSRR